jgi:hypothetical protein
MRASFARVAGPLVKAGLLGEENFCGGDGLAHVALSVIGDVDEQAGDGGWQLLATDVARFLQCSVVFPEFVDSWTAGCEGGE